MKDLKLRMEGLPPAWLAAVLRKMISVSKTHKPRTRVGVFESVVCALGNLGQGSVCWALGSSVAPLFFTHVEGAVFTPWLLIFPRCCFSDGKWRFDLYVLLRPIHQQSPQNTRGAALGSEQWPSQKPFKLPPKKTDLAQNLCNSSVLPKAESLLVRREKVPLGAPSPL